MQRIDNQGLQFSYKDSVNNKDYVLEGADFDGEPWVESFYQFHGGAHHEYHSDVVLVNIPAKKGPGHYIIFYNFGGYYDCIDVNIVTEPVTSVIGTTTTTKVYKYFRVDHCQFVDPVATHKCYSVVDSLEQCQQQCDAMGIDECAGVNVAPIKTPNTALFPDQTHIPWGTDGCKKKDFSGKPEGALLCYAIKPRSTIGNARDTYEISEDPNDSIFYGTCYLREEDNGIATNQCSATDRKDSKCGSKPIWYFDGRCIDCKQWQKNLDPSIIPRWDILSDECIDCHQPTMDPPSIDPPSSPTPSVNPTPGTCTPSTDKLVGHIISDTVNVWQGDDNALEGTYEECVAKCCNEPTCVAFVRKTSDANNVNSKCWFKKAVCPTSARTPNAAYSTNYMHRDGDAAASDWRTCS